LKKLEEARIFAVLHASGVHLDPSAIDRRPLVITASMYTDAESGPWRASGGRCSVRPSWDRIQ
jgi:hypothetical protein